MQVKLEGNTLTIIIELDPEGKESSSKKTIVHAYDKDSEIDFNGKKLVTQVTAYTYAKEKA
jgi:hypothetical protein